MTESLITDSAAPSEAAPSSPAAVAPVTAPAATEAAAATTSNATDGQTAPARELRADGEQPADAQAAKPPEGAPESYEFKAPDGKTYAPEVVAEFSQVARELNMTQDAAQKMIEKMAPVIQAQQLNQLQGIQAQWLEASKTDKEFGGEKLQENLSVAKKALDSFGSPELRTLLNESGLGNHPDVIRFMVKAGRAISEDKFVGGAKRAPSSHPKDLAASLYPNQTH
jgi:hypothetical protein